MRYIAVADNTESIIEAVSTMTYTNTVFDVSAIRPFGSPIATCNGGRTEGIIKLIPCFDGYRSQADEHGHQTHFLINANHPDVERILSKVDGISLLIYGSATKQQKQVFKTKRDKCTLLSKCKITKHTVEFE